MVKNNLSEYENLTLLDLETRQSVALTKDTTVYHFTTEGSNKVSRRFKLVNSKNVTDKFSFSDLSVSYYNGKVVTSNYTNMKGVFELYDVSGRLVMSKPMNISSTSYPMNIAKGSYIVRAVAGGKESKLKIIVK